MNSPHQSKHKFNRESDRTRFDEKKVSHLPSDSMSVCEHMR